MLFRSQRASRAGGSLVAARLGGGSARALGVSRKARPVKKREQLTESDFAQAPVWVAAGGDEYAPREKRGAAPLLSLVSTQFTAADGSAFRGFGLSTKVALVAPIIFAKEVQVPLHFGNKEPTAEDLAKAYELLNSSPERLFPLSVTIEPPLKYKPVWAEFLSFTYQGSDGSIHEVR